MRAFFAFFGQFYLLVLIACGVLWMLSPRTGKEVAKRVGMSVLLFIAAMMLLPGPREGLIAGAVRGILGFALGACSLYFLIDPKRASAFMRGAAITSGASLVVYTGLIQLWSTTGGRVLTAVLLLAAAGLYARARSKPP